MPGAAATPSLAFGCSRLGSALTPLDRRESIALIRRAYDLGIRHFDTASIYGQGDSERLLGAALGSDRRAVCLASKAGQLLTPKQALLAHLKPLIRWMAARRRGLRQRVAQTRAQGVPRCFTPAFIEQSLHASLRRLATDHLDIFYLHSPEPAVLGDTDLFDSLERLQAQGLFKSLGVSCDDLVLAQRAAAHPKVQVVQFEFDGSAACAALLGDIERAGKSAVLRGLFRWASAGAQGHGAAVHPEFRQALASPALAGILMGTVRQTHLEHNVLVFQRALCMDSPV